jgi:hypothetical protein
MPRYTFKLSDDGSGVEDDVGVSLPNAEAAYRYACNVVFELMNCRELWTRHWQLDVYEAEGKKVLKFLSKESIRHLGICLRSNGSWWSTFRGSFDRSKTHCMALR